MIDKGGFLHFLCEQRHSEVHKYLGVTFCVYYSGLAPESYKKSFIWTEQ